MDTNKPQTSDEEGAPPPPLLARTPFRPLSRRRRQALPPDPQPAVERPTTSTVFNASPNTVAAALAGQGAAPDGAALTWARRPVHRAEGVGDVSGDESREPGELSLD